MHIYKYKYQQALGSIPSSMFLKKIFLFPWQNATKKNNSDVINVKESIQNNLQSGRIK